MSGGNLFTVATAWDETTKRRERAMVVRCSKCPRSATVADNPGMARPMLYFADRFRRKGWRIGARSTAHVCPHCIGGLKPKPALTPAQKQAAFCRIAGVPRAASSTVKPKEPAMSKPAKTPALSVVAEAPRQPTRDDIRSILDALGDCYLVEKGCYAKDDSDEALAKRLNVPRAWVTAERDRAFGPDASEDDGEDRKLIPVLIERADQLEAKSMALAEDAEALRLDVRRLEGRLAKRGVA